MERPCVRVDREDGEAARRALEAAGVRDPDHRIESDGSSVYIPVTDPEAVPPDYDVVERAVEARERQRLPGDVLGFAPTYERLGDLVLLQEDDPERAAAAARAFMASDLPVATVLNRASPVRGDERVPEWTILAGERTETVHREHGATFTVDPTLAYFSPRLATERQRVIEQVEPGEHVVDMFAGVGPYAIRAAIAGAEVLAVDINPDAVRYCRANARDNGVEGRVTVLEGDVGEVTADYHGWADRVVMNLPHTAHRYLDVAADLSGESARLHYYDIQPEADPFEPGEAAIAAAFEDGFDVEVADRRRVRSYAPGVWNVCLDVDVHRRPA